MLATRMLAWATMLPHFALRISCKRRDAVWNWPHDAHFSCCLKQAQSYRQLLVTS